MYYRARKGSILVPNQSLGENRAPCEDTAPRCGSASASGPLQEKSVPGHQKPGMHDRQAPGLAAQRKCAIAGLRRADLVSMAGRVLRTCNFAGRAFHISILEGAGRW